MRYKTTQKQVKANSKIVLRVGYCYMYNILKFHYSEAYTTRAEGWASDIYYLDNGVTISTGYSPFGIDTNYQLINTYEKKARKVLSNKWGYNRKKVELNKMLNKLISELIK